MDQDKRKGFQYLAEGNRDKVLEKVSDLNEDEEVLWLKANSVESHEERLKLLSHIAQSNSKYGVIASRILMFEKQIEEELSEPPKYQFWKKSSLKDKNKRHSQ